MLWTIIVVLIVIILIIIAALVDLITGFKKDVGKYSAPKPAPSQTTVTLFSDGHRFIDALKRDMSQAKQHIHLAFFIFRYDQIGQELVDTLLSYARKGVKIRLLLDYLGSRGFPKKIQNKLSEAGIELGFTAKPTFPFTVYSLNRRNHHKTVVIDGKIGYFGGFNIGDEYLGIKSDMGDWRDYHLRLEGEGVKELQKQFLYNWQITRQQALDGDEFFPALPQGKSNMSFVPTAGKGLEALFIEHLSKAKKRLFIGTPYFIPTKRMQNVLIGLLKRNVEVTLLLPLKRDHPFVRPASFHFLGQLLNCGAKVYHFYQGFYHAKVFIVDDSSCYLGTANFDQRSFFWNDEMNAFIYDQELIAEVEKMTIEDLRRSTPFTIDDLKKRSAYEKLKTTLSLPMSPLL
ncbi:cardiolipin synthase [Pullulanibacillus camelliae]|nr:cardiolipin synthase [Pullulanibacillus camelliae]